MAAGKRGWGILAAQLKQVFCSKMFWAASLLLFFTYLYSAEIEFRFLAGTGSFSAGAWQEKQLKAAGYYEGIISFFLPIGAVLPYALSYRRERDSGYRVLMVLKASGSAYRRSKLLAVAASGAGAACIPFLCWLPVSLWMGAGQTWGMGEADGSGGSWVWHKIGENLPPLLEHPTLLVLLYLGNQMLVAAAFAVFALGVSAVARNRYLAVMAPMGFGMFTELAVDNFLARRFFASYSWNGLTLPMLGMMPLWHHGLYVFLLFGLGIGLFLGGDRYAEKA